MLRPIVTSTEATHLIDSLSLMVQIEAVLKEDMITLKARYMMMSMLDHCMYPRPRDAFGSDVRRSEIYGLNDDSAEDSQRLALNHSTQITNIDVDPPDATGENSTRYAHTFFTTRNVASAEQVFHKLPPPECHLFTGTLISKAMGSGDETDIVSVASFLALPSVRRTYSEDSAAFRRCLEAEIAMLEDTVLDCPSAYRAMATMLYAADLPTHLVEDLASRIITRKNPARDRLLEEFNALSVGADDALEQSEDGAEYTSGEEGSASGYAYAY
uniref:TAL effector protein Tal2a (AvrBs3 and PthA family of transcription activator-like effector proteins) n=1 Tax=Ganoderma boninense TaxID=34458 RepID=A0A5K1JXC3_9APHY|nr:TAL effector protein Tal2a (AvrBs3 and PthA family of transcription activator-like effector proteins) [Ganoderma boninense]